MRFVRSLILALFVAVAIVNVSSADPKPAAAGASPDELFVRVARQAPGFGGAFVDETAKQLKIWLSQPSTEAALAARGALAEVLSDPELATYVPVPLKASYDFPTLKAWHDSLSPGIGGMAGVISNDIDERINRLRVGIESLDARPDIERAIAALGVPLAAVSIVEQEPVHFQSLQDFHRPVIGGLQIARDAGGVWYICTAGFIATSGLIDGIVTNAHCSRYQGEPWDGTKYHQPDPLVDPVGAATEVADPYFFTGGVCPSGKRCRYSDASWNQWVLNGAALKKGDIANAAVGSPAWDHVSTFPIKSKGNPVVGNRLNKVGRTTGLTAGNVEQICVDINVTSSNIRMLCQGDAAYASQGGDSGAGVWRLLGDPGYAKMSGLHWGSGGAFSLISRVEQELGTLKMCTSGYSC